MEMFEINGNVGNQWKCLKSMEIFGDHCKCTNSMNKIKLNERYEFLSASQKLYKISDISRKY